MKLLLNADHDQGGFTLVELAIVLVIVGLIIGGILVGQDMVHSAPCALWLQTWSVSILQPIRLEINTMAFRGT